MWFDGGRLARNHQLESPTGRATSVRRPIRRPALISCRAAVASSDQQTINDIIVHLLQPRRFSASTPTDVFHCAPNEVRSLWIILAAKRVTYRRRITRQRVAGMTYQQNKRRYYADLSFKNSFWSPDSKRRTIILTWYEYAYGLPEILSMTLNNNMLIFRFIADYSENASIYRFGDELTASMNKTKLYGRKDGDSPLIEQWNSLRFLNNCTLISILNFRHDLYQRN